MNDCSQIAADQLRSGAPQPRCLPAPSKRATIGLLTSSIHVDISRNVWHGVLEAAERADVNLLCFVGGILGATEQFEAQRNVVYDLVDVTYVQGLISWASSLGAQLAPGEIDAYHQRYHPLPIISLTQPMAHVPTVTIDSYQGTCAALAHLIEVHGYRRLAFIRGPIGHYPAQERFFAYTDTLQHYGIPFDPRLVSAPLPFQPESGVAAMHAFLDEAQLRVGSEVQAVMAVSDLVVLGALSVLQARGLRVPDDIALVGFNDSVEGRFATPPLTSVALPFSEQGARAVETLLTQLNGTRAPERVQLQSRLIVRQSCGCLSQAVAHADATLVAHAQALGAERVPAHAALSAQLAHTYPEATARRAAHLLAQLQADLASDMATAFMAALQHTFNQDMTSDEVASWQDIVSIMRRAVLPTLDTAAQQCAENVFSQARVFISEIVQRAQGMEQLCAAHQSTLMREIGQELITTFDIDTLAEVLALRLPQLGIASGYVAVYENPAASLERARLVLAYTEHGRLALAPGKHTFLARELVPRALLPRQRRYSMVVEPLFFRDEQIGFAVLEIGPRDGDVYEVLRGYMSSALKGALLVHEAHNARLAAEKADRIKTRLLANVSHELRTPLHIILEHAKDTLAFASDQGSLPLELHSHMQHIQSSAKHQLHLINDLLDLSRAEIDALDLYSELLDPRLILEEVFQGMAERTPAERQVRWKLRLPERLPWIYADAMRLRQILLNLLSNAQKFTERGHITLGANVVSPDLHIWVKDTGIGVSADQQEHIFEPFTTVERYHELQLGGIGLGLSITRRLVALHHGSIAIESAPGAGSTFHVYLPLPSLSEQTALAPTQVCPVLLIISAVEQLASEIVEFSQRQELALHHLPTGDDLEEILADVQPAALAWDIVGARASDWATVRRLQGHPRWSKLPFILYGSGQASESAPAMGFTSFVMKPANVETLLDVIGAACATQPTGAILIVDDDPEVRALHERVVTRGAPGYTIRAAADGPTALAMMTEDPPSLVLLDLIMPGMEGTDVLDQMRAAPALAHVPVIVLSNKLLSFDDVKRIEQHARVTLQNKGLLSEDEMIAALHRALFHTDTLPPYTSALVKRAVAYLHQNYGHAVARWALAEAVGVSEDYLSRVFNRELGMSPWDYLNRYRIYHAKALLAQTTASINAVAQQVGFNDQKYFSRVFRKLTGVGPKEFRGNTVTR